MAIYHFLLKEPFQTNVGMSTQLEFDGERVIVTWKRGNPVVMPARSGDLIFVDCWGGVPRVGKTRWPKRLDNLALWLIGAKNVRAKSFDEAVARMEEAVIWYHQKKEEFPLTPLLKFYEEFSQNRRWYIGWEEPVFSPGWHIISAYVSPDITADEVREIVNTVPCRWSREVIEKVLNGR